MDQHETRLDAEQTDQSPPVETLQPWQQPKLERLNVSLDTANSIGSGTDGLSKM
ncbi:MAG: hypothetical protein H6643_05050 [Caldilineaceae bacterium]|nr:hypothetical protein [Caldilineaceae bacterium]